MSETILKTFVHISDLHIGEIDPTTGDADLTPVRQFLLSNKVPFFDGLLGHHKQALEDLESFMMRLRRSEGIEPNLIVTGDLTRFGEPMEFRTALEYISQDIDVSPPHGNFVGLNFWQFPHHFISGNHDHWDGAIPPK